MEAAIGEIERSALDKVAKRHLRLFLANNAHLLPACVPGDVVATLQEEMQGSSVVSCLSALLCLKDSTLL